MREERVTPSRRRFEKRYQLNHVVFFDFDEHNFNLSFFKIIEPKMKCTVLLHVSRDYLINSLYL